jgi:outer membrane receptor protein involved in Fe transport
MIYLCVGVVFLTSIGGKIQGTVTDGVSGEPIQSANVLVLETEIGAATDASGDFFILNVAPGRYVVEVSCLGYGTKRIANVILQHDETARLSVVLEPTAIEISPVTVTSERPAVSKEMVGTTYLVRKEDISSLPVDYTVDLIAFQASVARRDTALHVRGGRATEVQYMIDNVSIIDPQTGNVAINLTKGIIDEVIFLPGGFNAEYGRAMSGIINMITSHPADYFSTRARGKTERIMSEKEDFGYENVQTSLHVPLNRRLKGYFALDIMHTDDWDPRLQILPHKERDDYSLYGKWLYDASAKLKLALSGAMSRSQFDRYETLWKFHLDHYRSDLERGNLQTLNVSYLPDTRKFFQLTLSRLYSHKTYGVREDLDYSTFEDFAFRPYSSLEWLRSSMDNPYGAYVWKPYCAGDYPEFGDKTANVIKTTFNTDLQLHRYHQMKAGCEYVLQDFSNLTYFISDSSSQLLDEYDYQPTEYSLYVQDNIDFKGVYAKLGCRYDYFSSDIEGVEPKHYLSPRLGVSFEVTEKFIFRANLGQYAQPPLYDYMYSYYSLLPLPSYLFGYVPIIGNPELTPEKTVSYELGLQGEISTNLSATVNTFYKDVTDLIGTRQVRLLPLHHEYFQYVNIEYANIKGIETILEINEGPFTGKVSYTLSWAKGTSSYASEFGDTIYERPASDYYLDFDQRHRLFVQGTFRLPMMSQLHIFGYFGNGFPYTPPDPEGKYEEKNYARLPFQRQIDCLLSKTFKLAGAALSLDLEIINLLNHQYEITTHYPQIREPHLSDFDDYITFYSDYYNPAADANHDGMISPYEDYWSYVAIREATDDIIYATSAPRRVRIGVSLNY